MKKALLLSILFLIVGANAMAQDSIPVRKPRFQLGGDGIYLRDSVWKLGGFLGFTVSQTALYQWGPGGSNNFSFLLGVNFYANYKKNKTIWDNSIDAKWGMVANGMIRNKSLAQRNFQKNIDLLAIKTLWGYHVTDHLYAGAKLGFESQFTRSYDYSLTDTSHGRFRKYTISKFGAPAILTIGPGLTWKPKDYFTLFFSPVEGKMTFVSPDHTMRSMDTVADGTFVDAHYTDVDETRFGLKAGKQFMGELGWELDLLFQKDIVKNVNWKSHLNVFGAYMNANYNTEMPFYYEANDSMGTKVISDRTKHIPVVKWDNDLVFKVNKWLSATLSTRFVYQYNAKVPIDKRKNDTLKKGPDGVTDMAKGDNPVQSYNKLQIFEQFGIALAFKF